MLRGISVTDEGARFYGRCVQILAQIEDAAAVAVGTQQLIGQVRVQAPPSLSTALIAPNLHRFYAEHPSVTVDLHVSSATPDLVREQIDVALVVSEEPPTKQARIELAGNPQRICAAPSYLAEFGVPRTPDDLAHHRCLMSRFSELAAGWPLWNGMEWQVCMPNVVLLSDDGEVLRRACVHGAGIGLLYWFHVQQDIQDGRLIEVLAAYPARPKKIFAIIPHRELVRPGVKLFIDFMRGVLGSNGDPIGEGVAQT